VLLVISPWIYYQRLKIKKKIRQSLQKYNGKIVFLYGEYHTHDFKAYFEFWHPEIDCFEIPNHKKATPFIRYLNADNPPKSLPQLVKIIDEATIKKKHYTTFKHYVRRNNDEKTFYKFIERSIKNLEKIE
jgi:hypothetical protein